MRRVLPFLLLLLSTLSCNEDPSFFTNTSEASTSSFTEGLADADVPITQRELTPPVNPSSQDVVSSTAETSLKKIIKNGSLVIDVDSLYRAKATLDKIIKQFEGYYDRESFQDEDYSLRYNLAIRVPVNSFDPLVSALENGFNRITDKEVSAVDVTSQYKDIESRLSSKKTALEQYRNILKKAQTIKEVLEVQDYIRKLEEEIESTTVRLKQLQDQTSYSTLNVTLIQKIPVEYTQEEKSFWTDASHAFTSGWNGLEAFLILLIRVWPFLIITAVLIWGIRRLRGS
ncbi:MAG: hypothetical protein CMI36_09020 [Owenweeksia sp.]|nr:hypothetical protein [Owenweeksia sp.]MBF99122.1 hypothetical protein [Owenweeksia sp.]HBF21143.1 hypothetical protein [Cryomorphaceae bacterium]